MSYKLNFLNNQSPIARSWGVRRKPLTGFYCRFERLLLMRVRLIRFQLSIQKSCIPRKVQRSYSIADSQHMLPIVSNGKIHKLKPIVDSFVVWIINLQQKVPIRRFPDLFFLRRLITFVKQPIAEWTHGVNFDIKF